VLVENGLIERGSDGVHLFDIANLKGEIVQAARVANPLIVLPENESLRDFEGQRAVLLTELTQQDPVAKAVNAVAPEKSRERKQSEKQEPPIAAAMVLQSLSPDEVLSKQAPAEDKDAAHIDDDAQGAGHAQAVAPVPKVSTDSTPLIGGNANEQKPSGRVNEGEEKDFEKLLPPEFAAMYRKVRDRYTLGRIVHVVRTPKELNGFLARTSENGFAIEQALLAEWGVDAAGFLGSMVESGHLWTSPSTSRRLIYPVPVAEGSATTKVCFVITHSAAKRMGLTNG
jgi:hypothetical protein